MKASSRGFTIVEIMVIIIVIGILLAIGIVSFQHIQKQSRDTKRATDLTLFRAELEKYYDRNGEYPSDVRFASIAGTAPTSYIASSGITVGPTTTPAQLRTVAASVPDDFGDPKRTTSMFSPQTVAASGSDVRYFYIGGINFRTSTTYSASATFTMKSGSFTCAYSVAGTPNDSGSYIVGHYSETDDKMVFLRGNQGNPIDWNTGNNASCALAN